MLALFPLNMHYKQTTFLHLYTRERGTSSIGPNSKSTLLMIYNKNKGDENKTEDCS